MTGPKRLWRQGFLLACLATVGVIISSVRFFLLPIGATIYPNDWIWSFVFPLSAICLLIGVPLSVWGIRARWAKGRSIALDLVGLFLNLVPYWLAMLLVNLAVVVRRLSWDD